MASASASAAAESPTTGRRPSLSIDGWRRSTPLASHLPMRGVRVRFDQFAGCGGSM
jgi:hypothetical protein